MSKVLEALKRKYSTPEAALRALSVSPGLLAEDAAMMRSRRGGRDELESNVWLSSAKQTKGNEEPSEDRRMRGRDEEEEPGWNDVEDEVLDEAVMYLHDKLKPEDMRHVMDLLGMSEAMDRRMRGADRRGRSMDRRRMRGAVDDPRPFFGRPRVGGGMDPVEDRRMRGHALDAGGDSFADLFPGAAAIRRV